MTEALIFVGFAVTLLQLIKFGTKIVRRLREIEDHTLEDSVYFKGLRIRFLLILDLVKKIMLQMDVDLVSDRSKEIMYSVVQNCITQAQQLDKLISRSLSLPKDNS